MYLNYKGLRTIINTNYMYLYNDISPNGILIKDGYMYKVKFSFIDVEKPNLHWDNMKVFENELESKMFDRASMEYIGKLGDQPFSFVDLIQQELE